MRPLFKWYEYFLPPVWLTLPVIVSTITAIVATNAQGAITVFLVGVAFIALVMLCVAFDDRVLSRWRKD